MSETTTTPRDEDAILAAEYVLGVLDHAERRAFARRIANEPRIAEAVRYWEEHFAQFTEAIEPVSPPPQLRNAIELRLFAENPRQRSSIWANLNLWRGLAAASTAGLLVLGAWNLRSVQTPDQQGLVAQVLGEQKLVQLAAFYDEATGELRLNRTEGSAQTGRSFELWLIAGNDAPVSLGVLPGEQLTRLTVPAPLRGKMQGGVLAISDEPQGGSPTGAPTGAVLATGKLTSI